MALLGRGSARRLLRLLDRSLTTLSSFTELPVIDVGPLTNPGSVRAHPANFALAPSLPSKYRRSRRSLQSAVERQAVGQALHDACKNVGFFYASNHGLPTDVTTNVMAEARRWFAMPVSS